MLNFPRPYCKEPCEADPKGGSACWVGQGRQSSTCEMRLNLFPSPKQHFSVNSVFTQFLCHSITMNTFCKGTGRGFISVFWGNAGLGACFWSMFCILSSLLLSFCLPLSERGFGPSPSKLPYSCFICRWSQCSYLVLISHLQNRTWLFLLVSFLGSHPTALRSQDSGDHMRYWGLNLCGLHAR